MASHCHAKLGPLEDGKRVIVEEITSHNFVNKLDLIFPSGMIDPLADLALDGYKVKLSLQQLLELILKLDPAQLESLKLVSLNTDVSHFDTVCIANGILSLRLTSETYGQSGFKGTLTTLSRGNKSFHTHMYNVRIPLVGLKRHFDANDKNTTRLFWFAEKKPFEFDYYLTVEDEKCLGSIKYEPIHAVARKYNLGPCTVPSLQVTNDQDWLSETLEWLSYASVPGPQLFPHDNTDSYISSYSSLLESTDTASLFKVSLYGGLIETATLLTAIQTLLSTNLPWFGAIIYGVKDCNLSYGTANEHTFVQDGCNDTAILVSGDQFCLWNVVGSGDAHR